MRPRRWAAGLALVLALALPAAAEPIALAATPIDLLPGHPEMRRIGRLEFLGGLHLVSRDPRFGGLSGLEVLPDGRLLAVSDTGCWTSFRPVLDAHGRLADAVDGDLEPLRDAQGHPLDNKWLSDAEAVRREASGGFLVSFERRHRVLRYAAPGGAGAVVPTPPDLNGQPENGGIEAMAAWPDGRLLLISEQARTEDGDLKAWLRVDGRWHALSYPLAGEGLPTDAAALPSGDLVVLERRFGMLTPLGARVMRVPLAHVVPGGKLHGETLAQWEAPLSIDNMEGIAVQPAPGGGILLWLVSDDNFRRSQRTLLLLFRLE
jgi:hypothetical protein